MVALTVKCVVVATAVLLLISDGVLGDVYMHNPRGSNNRLNERSANRNNGNRMFDSQNNNRGGYNKGDEGVNAFDDYNEQYDMAFFMSHPDHLETGNGESILSVEWTNQHGCGGNDHNDPHKLNCNMVLQYMCVPEIVQEQTRGSCDLECRIPVPGNENCDKETPPCGLSSIIDLDECAEAGYVIAPAELYDQFNCPHDCTSNSNAASAVDCGPSWQTHADGSGWLFPRDGLNTNRQEYTNPSSNGLSEQARFNRKDGDVVRERGLHEDWDYYDECYRRERNRGLFTADQNLRSNSLGYSSAVFTRQNPNNNRRGYECPEERDHWPYWHPSPWVDIAVLTDRVDLCPFYQAESQNVKGKHFCRNTRNCANCIRFNNEEQCTGNGGNWVLHPPHYKPAPECRQAEWTRVNHLGNGRNGQPVRYNWTLPFLSFPEDSSVNHRCVLRLRYNISTDDYDAWRVNASFNNNAGAGVVSPVRQNPNVDIGAKNTALRLAINTAQFGRTFQDRSHVFRLIPRSKAGTVAQRPRLNSNPNTADFFGDRTLYNLNVRGKRGNIVQTFPSVEYDFVPNHLHMNKQDLIHIQWTGSNTHNNGNPAGDGQAGDAGEGRGGTDRHNFVELRRREFGESYPATWEENTIFKNMVDALDGYIPQPTDIGGVEHHTSVVSDRGRDWDEVRQSWALRMASVGFYRSFDYKTSGGDDDPNSIVGREDELNPLLDNAPASYAGGVFRFAEGVYNYMCTRNHNFSNRDQKGHLIVEGDPVGDQIIINGN
eukprot:m.32523 g.32523  ORF g.32523 m.32523 type:complete len:769 (+) comp9789_c0_seq1:45-2351(+)